MENKFATKTKTYERTKNKILLNFSKYGELPVEYEGVCRLCLEKNETMHNIFKDDDIIPTYVKIKTLLFLKVVEEDDLPELICNSCLQMLNGFYKFKKRCMANDTMLRQFFLKTPPKKSCDWNDDNLSLEKDSSALQKKSCTIDWDEQVIAARCGNITTTEIRRTRIPPPPPLHIIVKQIETGKGLTLREQVHSSSVLEDDYDDIPLGQRLGLNISDLVNITRSTNRSGDSRFRCKHCKVPITLPDWKEHRPICPAVPRCSYCSKTFFSNSLLKRHVRVHTKERPFSCKLCDKTFPQKETVDRHIKQVHNKEMYCICQYCDKIYSGKESLHEHIRIIHHKNGPKYCCTLCSKRFTYASGLSRHKQVHSGTRYICPECNKVFTDSSAHKRHVQKIHPTVKSRATTEI